MLEFFASYIWLAVGFMMAFMILFPGNTSFSDFPGGLVSVIVMMLGEMEFKELYFPSSQIVNLTIANNTASGQISEHPEFQQFPGIQTIKDWRTVGKSHPCTYQVTDAAPTQIYFVKGQLSTLFNKV